MLPVPQPCRQTLGLTNLGRNPSVIIPLIYWERRRASLSDMKGYTDYRKAAQTIKDGGYATSPTYVGNTAASSKNGGSYSMM